MCFWLTPDSWSIVFDGFNRTPITELVCRTTERPDLDGALTVKLSMKAFVDDSREQTFIRAEVEIERLVI